MNKTRTVELFESGYIGARLKGFSLINQQVLDVAGTALLYLLGPLFHGQGQTLT
jgi:hypothetical protein